jgi:pyruvate kinase
MSISHSSEIPTLAGGMIDLKMIQSIHTSTLHRRTKIICTIGPACWDIPNLEILINSGMNVARLNFSHGDHPGHAMVLERVRQAATNTNRNVGT